MAQSAPAQLIVHGRPECHLCDDMLTALAHWQSELGFETHFVDIDRDRALAERYGSLIPVLTGDDGTEICHYWLDLVALRQYLTARAADINDPDFKGPEIKGKDA
ncbi:MAG: glutaredoxin family protein [Gammaproteobacteria bacterium]